jgi:hypothetical protein
MIIHVDECPKKVDCQGVIFLAVPLPNIFHKLLASSRGRVFGKLGQGFPKTLGLSEFSSSKLL